MIHIYLQQWTASVVEAWFGVYPADTGIATSKPTPPLVNFTPYHFSTVDPIGTINPGCIYNAMRLFPKGGSPMDMLGCMIPSDYPSAVPLLMP